MSEESDSGHIHHAKLEQEVIEAMAKNPHYPLGEPDAMKWAIAWRLIRDKNNIDANGDTDGWMVGWFANCMASSPPGMSLVDKPLEVETVTA